MWFQNLTNGCTYINVFTSRVAAVMISFFTVLISEAYFFVFFCCSFLFVSCPVSLSTSLDWAPQILDLDRHLELNLNSKAMILCSATGNPLPSHNSIELRKLDSTVLKVGRPAVASSTPARKPHSKPEYKSVSSGWISWQTSVSAHIS